MDSQDADQRLYIIIVVNIYNSVGRQGYNRFFRNYFNNNCYLLYSL